jgi:hypothetical protein
MKIFPVFDVVCLCAYVHQMVLSNYFFKVIVQRILRGVKEKLKKSVLANWRPARFSF